MTKEWVDLDVVRSGFLVSVATIELRVLRLLASGLSLSEGQTAEWSSLTRVRQGRSSAERGSSRRSSAGRSR